jgi:hypothetical protein
LAANIKIKAKIAPFYKFINILIFNNHKGFYLLYHNNITFVKYYIFSGAQHHFVFTCILKILYRVQNEHLQQKVVLGGGGGARTHKAAKGHRFSRPAD